MMERAYTLNQKRTRTGTRYTYLLSFIQSWMHVFKYNCYYGSHKFAHATKKAYQIREKTSCLSLIPIYSYVIPHSYPCAMMMMLTPKETLLFGLPVLSPLFSTDRPTRHLLDRRQHHLVGTAGNTPGGATGYATLTTLVRSPLRLLSEQKTAVFDSRKSLGWIGNVDVRHSKVLGIQRK